MSTWIDELERAASRRLPENVSAYVRGWAGDGQCAAEGEAAWAAVRLRPSVLYDRSSICAATTVLGTPVAAPVLVAPMAQQVAADPLGEAATARAAAAAGTLLGVSTNTAVAFDDVCAAGAPWWYQVYVMRSRELTRRLVERAVSAGARALILTVDSTALAPEVANIEPTDWPGGPASLRLTNLTDDELAAATEADLQGARDLTPAAIGWLHEISGLPVVVKGVLTGRDATRCVGAGAAAVLVSTHGGRRLGVSIGTAEALPEVVDAVDGAAEVYVDSGVRSGAQAVAALALGARAVFVGRPLWWALAVNGEAGVRDALGRLQDELVSTLSQVGVANIADLDRGHVRMPPDFGRFVGETSRS